MTPLGEEADIVHLQKAFPRNELTEREGQAPATSSSLSKKKKREGLGPSLTTSFGFSFL